MSPGTLPTSFVGTAAGAAGVSLRGMTVNSTLVLIDGHRATNYPLADDGQRTFVDLNTIPLDAVDHIEVLKDGGHCRTLLPDRSALSRAVDRSWDRFHSPT